MKISQLIKKLEEHKAERGDIDVRSYGDEESQEGLVNSVKYYPRFTALMVMPEHIEISFDPRVAG